MEQCELPGGGGQHWSDSAMLPRASVYKVSTGYIDRARHLFYSPEQAGLRHTEAGAIVKIFTAKMLCNCPETCTVLARADKDMEGECDVPSIPETSTRELQLDVFKLLLNFD